MAGPLVPFREIVLKVHSRCDLACDHCYVYEAADQNWRQQPGAISGDVISHTARRLAEHAEKHRLSSVSVILHGGEPLLAGPERLRRVCEVLTAAVAPVAELDLRIHTNGVLLRPRHLDGRAARPGPAARGRRAALRALLDVEDLYDMDGAWQHPTPWGPLPVSRLLAETYEGVVVAAYGGGARTPAEFGRALEALERAAELTVTGKRLVHTVHQEWEEASRGREHH